MKKNILIPTDFSNNARSALVYALKLYANEPCTFYILHSTHLTDSVSRTYITTHYVEQQKQLAEQKLLDLKVATELVDANVIHSVEIFLSEDDIKTAINKAIKKHSIDLVVMGTKGASNAIGFFMGSNTVTVLKNIKNCPVLIIPDEYHFVEPKQIAFSTDYNRFYDGQELMPLKYMASLFDSEIRVVHINAKKKLTEIQEYNMMMLIGYLGIHKHSLHWLPDYTKKSNAIATFIEDLQIDMLAMVNYKHGLLESFLNEPIIEKLAFQPTVPMLIIPD